MRSCHGSAPLPPLDRHFDFAHPVGLLLLFVGGVVIDVDLRLVSPFQILGFNTCHGRKHWLVEACDPTLNHLDRVERDARMEFIPARTLTFGVPPIQIHCRREIARPGMGLLS